MGAATRTIDEMRDIINNDMRDIYERAEGEEDIREVLELESAMEMECERRDTDAKALIRGTTNVYAAAVPLTAAGVQGYQQTPRM